MILSIGWRLCYYAWPIAPDETLLGLARQMLARSAANGIKRKPALEAAAADLERLVKEKQTQGGDRAKKASA